MPLSKGSSKKAISKNIKTLITEKPSVAREKAISTLAKRRGISKEKAKQIQAKAIAYSKAGKSRSSHKKWQMSDTGAVKA